jgi:hypothetical protein
MAEMRWECEQPLESGFEQYALNGVEVLIVHVGILLRPGETDATIHIIPLLRRTFIRRPCGNFGQILVRGEWPKVNIEVISIVRDAIVQRSRLALHDLVHVRSCVWI